METRGSGVPLPLAVSFLRPSKPGVAGSSPAGRVPIGGFSTDSAPSRSASIRLCPSESAWVGAWVRPCGRSAWVGSVNDPRVALSEHRASCDLIPLFSAVAPVDNLLVRQRTLAAGIALLLYAPSSLGAAGQAADFGFRFSVGSCLTERLDTFTGLFTKELGGYPVQTASSHVVLTDAQMAAIDRAVADIRFFDYPSPFNGVQTGLRQVSCVTPSVTYRLEVKRGGEIHEVVWNDQCTPTTAEADRLRNLMSMVNAFIHAHPEYKRLPTARDACE